MCNIIFLDLNSAIYFFSRTFFRREDELSNPVHEVLLSSRMAQVERERQATNAWFRRQAFAPGSLVGVDVVAPRVSPHPLVMFPRSYHHSLMELSMVIYTYYNTSICALSQCF